MTTSLTTTMPVEVTGLTSTEQALFAEILKDIQVSVERMAKAASKWVQMSDKAKMRIIEQTNPALRGFWARLERVGLGELHPLLLTVAGNAPALLGRMPIADQEKYLHELMPFWFAKGRGWDSRLIAVTELSEDQRKQIFKVASDGTVTVRDKDAQITYASDKKARDLQLAQAAERLKTVDRQGWKVERGRLFPKPGAVEKGFTKAQLTQMLKDMED